jgi:glutamine cyclotransferase
MRFQNIKLVAAIAFITIVISCNETPSSSDSNETDTASTPSIAAPKTINFSLVAEYPHDPKAFTEGLEYVNGYLYESTGKYGQSDIRKTDLKTGKVLQQQKLEGRYFGEGITVLGGKIYQLTYQEKTGFVYDLQTMKLLRTFTFPNNEGWGMTNDSTHVIYSDGTDKIYFVDPATFKEVKHIDVKDYRGQIININELEYIKGYIYANQWKTNAIYKIDPATGNVIAIADLTAIRMQGNIPEPVYADEASPEVMNGIAYDAATNRIFVTGKNWPKIFEVKLDN